MREQCVEQAAVYTTYSKQKPCLLKSIISQQRSLWTMKCKACQNEHILLMMWNTCAVLYNTSLYTFSPPAQFKHNILEVSKAWSSWMGCHVVQQMVPTFPKSAMAPYSGQYVCHTVWHHILEGCCFHIDWSESCKSYIVLTGFVNIVNNCNSHNAQNILNSEF